MGRQPHAGTLYQKYSLCELLVSGRSSFVSLLNIIPKRCSYSSIAIHIYIYISGMESYVIAICIFVEVLWRLELYLRLISYHIDTTKASVRDHGFHDVYLCIGYVIFIYLNTYIKYSGYLISHTKLQYLSHYFNSFLPDSHHEHHPLFPGRDGLLQSSLQHHTRDTRPPGERTTYSISGATVAGLLRNLTTI